MKRPSTAASGRSCSGETWFRSFSSAHRAQPLQAPWRLPARLPDPVVTDRITPDADDIFPDFQHMSNSFAIQLPGRAPVHGSRFHVAAGFSPHLLSRLRYHPAA